MTGHSARVGRSPKVDMFCHQKAAAGKDSIYPTSTHSPKYRSANMFLGPLVVTLLLLLRIADYAILLLSANSDTFAQNHGRAGVHACRRQLLAAAGKC